MRWYITKKHLVGLIGLLVAAILILLFSGCSSDRDQAIANSAATIYEAASATEQGAPTSATIPAIKANAAAIIKASGATYEPAGVK